MHKEWMTDWFRFISYILEENKTVSYLVNTYIISAQNAKASNLHNNAYKNKVLPNN